ncbi:PsiF family protein [Pseudomonas aeruginosa]
MAQPPAAPRGDDRNKFMSACLKKAA